MGAEKPQATENKEEKKAEAAEKKDEKKDEAAEEKGDAAEKKDENKDEASDKKEQLFQVQGNKLGKAPVVSSFASLSVVAGVVALLTGVVVIRKTMSQAQA